MIKNWKIILVTFVVLGGASMIGFSKHAINESEKKQRASFHKNFEESKTQGLKIGE